MSLVLNHHCCFLSWHAQPPAPQKQLSFDSHTWFNMSFCFSLPILGLSIVYSLFFCWGLFIISSASLSGNYQQSTLLALYETSQISGRKAFGPLKEGSGSVQRACTFPTLRSHVCLPTPWCVCPVTNGSLPPLPPICPCLALPGAHHGGVLELCWAAEAAQVFGHGKTLACGKRVSEAVLHLSTSFNLWW